MSTSPERKPVARAASFRPPTTLLIDAGDMPSLAAVAMQHDPASVVLWSPVSERRPAARQIAQRHRDLLGCAMAVDTPWTDGDEAGPEAQPEMLAVMLMQAMTIARGLGARRVIWPVRFGPDAPETAAALRTAAMLSGLSTLWPQSIASAAGTPSPGSPAHSQKELAAHRADAEASKVDIECPLADLDGDQIVDLADDAGAPLDLFWPCRQGGEARGGSAPAAPCHKCPSCRFWMEAFETRELPWPFAAGVPDPARGDG